MREFKSLQPDRAPEGFDAEIHGEDPIIEVEEGEARVIVKYTFPGFYISDDDTDVEGEKVPFKQLSIASTGYLGEGGKPLLPSFGRYVQIPFNCDYKFAVDKGDPVQFDDVLVSPAQERLADSPDEEPVFEFDKDFYAEDAVYPEEIVKITGPFEIDDYNALLVHVSPFQYNPAKKKLLGYSDVTITIELSPKKEGEADLSPADPESNKEGFGNLFVNPKRGIEERVALVPPKIVWPPIWVGGPEFTILYYADFKKAAEALAQWKNARGLVTDIVSIDKVGNDVPKIKEYLRKKRKGRSRLRYALLLGDVDMITPEPVPGGPYGSNVTDYYYSTSRDYASSSDCVLPWLSIGRIPVRTLEEALGVVAQIVSYEKNPPSDPDYYDRMTFAAYFQDDDGPGQPGYGKADRAYLQTMEEIRQQMVAQGFDVQRVYVSNNPNPQYYYDGTPVPADVVASIVDGATATHTLVQATTEGKLVIGHRDHGGTDGWVHPAFRNTHLDAVTGSIPSVFFSLNCQTGHFDLSAPTECFAEKLLRRAGAAPSLIAPTRSSQTWLNNDLMKALFDATWGGVLPTFPGGTASYPIRRNRLGDILNYGKSYLPTTTSGSASYIKDHFEIYHVVGDPTLELWKDNPRAVRISAALRRPYLYIKLSVCPKDSVITIWWRERMLKRLEPSSTAMRISLKDLIPYPAASKPIPEPPPKSPETPPWVPALSPGFVCFWAPGHRFVTARFRYLS